MLTVRTKISAQKRYRARLTRVYSRSCRSELCHICNQTIAKFVALELDRMHTFVAQKADRGRHRNTTLNTVLNQHDIMCV